MSPEPPNTPDLPLLLAALWHVALGLAMGALQIASGMGLFRLATWRAPANFRDDFLYGFPLGLAAMSGLALLALAHPAGRVAAPILLIATIAPLVLKPSNRAESRAALATVLKVLPFAAAFGTFMALLWHGPTATLASRPLGDMVYYAALVDTFRLHLTPIPNLAVLGDFFALSNSVPSIIASALSVYVRIDPFLYLAGWGGAFHLLTFALGLSLVGREAAMAAAPVRFAAAFALMLASLYDPNWMVNSIPAAVTFPLFFLGWHMTSRPARTLGRAIVDAMLLLAGSALAKVTAVICLLPLVILSAPRSRLRDLTRGQHAVLAIAGAIAVAYGAAMLVQFARPYWEILRAMGVGPFTFQAPGLWVFTTITHLAFLVRDAGTVALLAAAVFCTHGTVRIVIIIGAVSFLAYPFLFALPLLAATLLMGLAVLHQPDRYARAPALVWTAAALLLTATLTVDPGQLQTSVAWVLCMGSACLIALREPQPGGEGAASARLPLAGAAGFAFAATAIATGAWHMKTGDRRPYASREWLTPAFRDIWLAVRHKTPADALVFTDRAGYGAELQHGANLYAIFGRRQVYIAATVLSELFTKPEERAARLKTNQEVLDGKVKPADLPEAKPFGSYYAVLPRDVPWPAAWTSIYENAEFRLLSIPQGR
jgi:hypothetical protein